MPSKFQQAFDKFGQVWGSSTLAQRILAIGLGVSVLAVFFLIIFWLNQTDYKILYANLFPEDASQVVELLKKDNIPFEIQNNGATILVPTDKVYETRLKLAGKGTLHGQGIGFEIFDGTSIGQTDFIQHINYQRALQGELARTISEYPDIENARIHLVLPDKSLFIEEQLPPSASIVLTIKTGVSLANEQVRSIVNLIMTSVEGMTDKHITISDTRGKILYQPKEDDGLGTATSTQLEYKSAIEKKLEQRIEQMLSPVVGLGKVVAKVSADVDFSQKTISKELFDPLSAVVRSEQKNDEESSGSEGVGAPPDPEYQGENAIGESKVMQSMTRSSSTTNYEINREEQQIVVPVGAVQRLSVAVLVDGKHVKGEDGSFTFTPVADKQLVRISQLVEKAVGLDQTRGDSIEVSSISFGSPEIIPDPSLMDTVSRYFQLMGKPVLNALLALLFLLLVVRPVIMTMIRPKVSEQEQAVAEGLPGSAERMALAEGATEEELEEMQARKRVEDAKTLATQHVEQSMDQAVMIVKNWLRQGEA